MIIYALNPVNPLNQTIKNINSTSRIRELYQNYNTSGEQIMITNLIHDISLKATESYARYVKKKV